MCLAAALLVAAPRPLLPLGPAPAAAQEPCFSDWSDAAPVVARERLVAVRAVQDLVRSRQAGDVVRITLCRQADRYVYRLLLRDDHGRMSSLTVDARAPFVR